MLRQKTTQILQKTLLKRAISHIVFFTSIFLIEESSFSNICTLKYVTVEHISNNMI